MIGNKGCKYLTNMSTDKLISLRVGISLHMKAQLVYKIKESLIFQKASGGIYKD
jgi:hypothetical protein